VFLGCENEVVVLVAQRLEGGPEVSRGSRLLLIIINNNNNNNTSANIYMCGAAIMTMAITVVIQFMDTCRLSTIGLLSIRSNQPTLATITIYYYFYYYTARKLIVGLA